jgi:hypothetical protein
MNLPLFLTAYDPTELPGGSIDPLGFGQGYTALAEALFPGLTGTAGEPAYFPVLCAGLLWADEMGAAGRTRAERRRLRQETALRMERAWGLAVKLHWRSATNGQNLGSGIEDGDPIVLRGVTYFERECERIERNQVKKVGTKFKVLARQSTYGMLGIYANVASRLGLIDLDDYSLTPALGVPLAESFVSDTLQRTERQEVQRLVQDGSTSVAIETLLRWGKRCHDPTGWPTTAAQSLKSGLLRDPDRTATLRVLQLVREHMGAGQTELDLLRVALSLTRNTVSLPIDERGNASNSCSRAAWLWKKRTAGSWSSLSECFGLLEIRTVRNACAARKRTRSCRDATTSSSRRPTSCGERRRHCKPAGNTRRPAAWTTPSVS